MGQGAWLTLVSTRSHRSSDALRLGRRQTPRDAVARMRDGWGSFVGEIRGVRGTADPSTADRDRSAALGTTKERVTLP
jgi:hypothetical protein